MDRLLDLAGARSDRVMRYPVDDDDYGLNMRSVEHFKKEGYRSSSRSIRAYAMWPRSPARASSAWTCWSVTITSPAMFCPMRS